MRRRHPISRTVSPAPRKSASVPRKCCAASAMFSENMQKVDLQLDEMRAEYDFSKGVRGKYAKQYAEGTNVVILEPDIAQEFPTAESVNQALRSLIPVIVTHRKAVVR